MRIYLEKKQKIENFRIAREEELLNLEFKEWNMNLNEGEKNKLLPKDIFLTGHKESFLRTYFKNEIWPRRREELEKEIFFQKN